MLMGVDGKVVAVYSLRGRCAKSGCAVIGLAAECRHISGQTLRVEIQMPIPHLKA